MRPLCLFALALLLPSAALAAPSPQDGGYGEGGGAEVFRYSTVDEETGEETGYHFLNGQPGEDVDGGFGFTDEAEGKSYDLTFVADENGYQPSADFLPQVPEETPEVREAKAAFYSLWEQIAAEHKQLMMERGGGGGGEGEESGVDSFGEDDDVDLRGGDPFAGRRRKRQAVYYYYPQQQQQVLQQQVVRPLVPVQATYPVLVNPFQQQVVQQQQVPFRILGAAVPAVPAVPATKPAEKPVVLPDIPETDQSGVDAF